MRFLAAGASSRDLLEEKLKSPLLPKGGMGVGAWLQVNDWCINV